MNTLEIPLPFDLPDWSPEVRELLRLVVVAHQQSALNNACISSYAAVNAMVGSGDFSKAAAGALLTIGGKHAPIGMARVYYENVSRSRGPQDYPGEIIDGFGNSFFPAGDPAWEPVSDYISAKFPEEKECLDLLTNQVQQIKPHLKPNAAMWTAIACSLAEIPEGYESLIFLLARAPAWAAMCLK